MFSTSVLRHQTSCIKIVPRVPILSDLRLVVEANGSRSDRDKFELKATRVGPEQKSAALQTNKGEFDKANGKLIRYIAVLLCGGFVRPRVGFLSRRRELSSGAAGIRRSAAVIWRTGTLSVRKYRSTVLPRITIQQSKKFLFRAHARMTRRKTISIQKKFLPRRRHSPMNESFLVSRRCKPI